MSLQLRRVKLEAVPVGFANEHTNALNRSCSAKGLLMVLTTELKSSLKNRSVISGSL